MIKYIVIVLALLSTKAYSCDEFEHINEVYYQQLQTEYDFRKSMGTQQLNTILDIQSTEWTRESN